MYAFRLAWAASWPTLVLFFFFNLAFKKPLYAFHMALCLWTTGLTWEPQWNAFRLMCSAAVSAACRLSSVGGIKYFPHHSFSAVICMSLLHSYTHAHWWSTLCIGLHWFNKCLQNAWHIFFPLRYCSLEYINNFSLSFLARRPGPAAINDPFNSTRRLVSKKF